MTVDLPLLLFGLLLLWFPRQWMRLGKTIGSRRRKTPLIPGIDDPSNQRESGDPRISFSREFSKIRNYFDLLRGGVGSLAIMGGMDIFPSIAPAPGDNALPLWGVETIKLAILFLGLAIQTTRYERHHVTFFAPIFYLGGLSLSLCTTWGAFLSFTLIWALNPMINGAKSFLLMYAIVMTSFALFFRDWDAEASISAFMLCFLPVLLSLLARRPLVVFSRKGTRSASDRA